MLSTELDLHQADSEGIALPLQMCNQDPHAKLMRSLNI